MWKPWTFPVIAVSGFILVGICTLIGLRAVNVSIAGAGMYIAPNVPPPPPAGSPPLPEQRTPPPVPPPPVFTPGTTIIYQSSDTSTSLSRPAVFNSSVPCNTPMSSTDFAAYKTRVAGKSFDDDKLREAKDVLTENCLSTQQIEIILNLFTHEDSKLEWAKYAYRRCTDHERYSDLYDSLWLTSVSELKKYTDDTKPTGTVSPIVTGTKSTGMPCTNAISPEEFTKLKEETEDEVSDDSKLETAKKELGNRCLTVSQAEEVMNIFSFNSARLEWAKFAYHHTSNTEDYPDLYDSLGSLSSKHELEEYIESQQGK